MSKSSVAIEPGAIVSLDDAHTEVFNETALDHAQAFVICNISDTAITLRMEPDGDEDIVVGEGVVLQPNGVWREENYAGAIIGRHNGTGGTKNIAVVVF